MKITHCIFIGFVFFGCNSSAQNADDIDEFLMSQIKVSNKVDFKNDTIVSQNLTAIVPKPSDDTLTSILRDDFFKNYEYLLSPGLSEWTISTEYEVKSYVPSTFISVVEKTISEISFDRPPSFSSRTINYIFYKSKIYRIELQPSLELRKYADSIVKINFDKDCLENGTLNEHLNLFIESGKFFIDNPLHSKVCDDSIELQKDVVKLEYTLIGNK